MREFLSKYKYKIRAYIFFFLVCVSYFFAVFYLFWNHDIFSSIISIFFLFIFAHFSAIDYRELKIKYVIYFMLFLVIIDLVFFIVFARDINIWIILSLLVLTSSLWVLFYSLQSNGFNSVSYFLRGGYIFTLFVTIAYSLTFIWIFRYFPFTCEWLKDASNKLIEFVEKPIVAPFKKIKTLSWNKDNASSDKVNKQMEEVLLWFQWVEISAKPNTIFNPMVVKINERKEDTIDELLADQKSYSLDVCNILLKEINEKYMLKELGLSAVMLTYFLLFGFVRLAIFIMSFIWFLMFKLLYWLWVYKIEKMYIKVEEIK